MIASFPATMLRSDQRAVKDVAAEQPVLITGSDSRNLMFGGLGGLGRRILDQREESAYEDRIYEAVERARAGIARGEYVVGIEAAVAESERMRLAHG